MAIEAQRRITTLDPPFGFRGVDRVAKEENGIILDVDYYTAAPTAVGTFSSIEWIPQAARVVRRELESILEQ